MSLESLCELLRHAQPGSVSISPKNKTSINNRRFTIASIPGVEVKKLINCDATTPLEWNQGVSGIDWLGREDLN
ncbi:MAG: hypothetical protein AAF085_11705 [Planctomycetota bacterium]